VLVLIIFRSLQQCLELLLKPMAMKKLAPQVWECQIKLLHLLPVLDHPVEQLQVMVLLAVDLQVAELPVVDPLVVVHLVADLPVAVHPAEAPLAVDLPVAELPVVDPPVAPLLAVVLLVVDPPVVQLLATVLLVVQPQVVVPLAVVLLAAQLQVEIHQSQLVAKVHSSPRCFKKWNVSRHSWVEISNLLANLVQFRYPEWNKFPIPLLLGSLHTV
jgi:hypothetical protein